ncbi:alpha/beta fold hydrolase [Thermoproteota archaeon]
MSVKAIKKALKNFGLTEKEVDVYIILAKHGILTAGQISKLTKIQRPHVYRTLKSLKKKRVAESTLEAPTRFSSVSFEKILDENIKIKQEEASLLEKTKKDLLSDWNKISSTIIEPDVGKFFVIEGNRKIYFKISEMIKKTKSHFLAIFTVPELVRNEQYGVFDAIYSHPFKSKIKFQFLTELSIQNLKAMKLLNPKLELEAGFKLKGRNLSSSFALLPRMVIKDNDEILFFITPKSDIFRAGQNEACICTNNASLVQALTGIFKDLWRDSTDIEKKILEIEKGKLPLKHLLTKTKSTPIDYEQAFIQVKEYTSQLPLLTAELERIEHSTPNLVGRGKELGQLQELAEKALRGNGKTVIISGEAGIGKTRLANELVNYAEAQNLLILKHRCTSESSIPLWPIRKVLADLFDISREDTPEIRRKKIGKIIAESVPEFVQLVPIIDKIIAGFSILPTISYEHEFKMDSSSMISFFESATELVDLSQCLVALSKKQPLILFFDDLHLADSSTLKLCQNLAGAIKESHFFMIGTYRQEAVNKSSKGINSPFCDFLQNMKGNILYQNIELERLNENDTSSLIKNVLATDNDLLQKQIYNETEGNPFFILETLKFLITKKLLKKKDQKWELIRDQKKIEIPPRIHDLLLLRINILKEEERDILDCACVIGEEFSSELIKEITGLNRLKLLKKLNNIEKKYQLIHSSNGLFKFDHSKIREVLYQEMVPELRKEYHFLTAKKLEEIHQNNLNQVVNQLSYHFYKSQNPEKAVPYLLKAGEKSRKEWAIFETIQYYLQALEMMENNEGWNHERTATLEVLGTLLALNAEHDKANEFYQKAVVSTSDEIIKDRILRKIQRKKIVENDGVKLAYYVYGEGEPTIFLLAFHATAELWIPQVTYFSQKHKVITIDMRGTGESDKPSGEYTSEVHVSDVKSIIDDTTDDNIIFVASFVGARIAIKYVTNYSEKISKLILLSFNPGPVNTTPGFNKKAFDEFHERAVKNPSWYTKHFLESAVPDPRFRALKKWGLKSMQKTPPEIFVKSIFSHMDEDIRPLLKKINIPTLILEGDKTRFYLEKVKYLQEQILGSKAYIFRDIGSCFLNMQRTNKFNDILEQFIKTGEILKE